MKQFHKSFTQQEPLPEASIAAATEIMRSGRLHRYNTLPGEVSQTALLEEEFASYLGVPYCLACASGGYALQLAMRALGIAKGEPVLTNAFTLAPVPGAIEAVGARAQLVEITDDLVIDLDDLEHKARDSGASYLMLSYMRGHIPDMQALMELSDRRGLVVIEDCAHTMGASFNGRKLGTFGKVACFSTQTYKHVNSGEGGLVTTEDPTLMAKAIVLSGSYMLYERHLASPDKSVFEEIRLQAPNCSGRMDNLRAAILRPQLADLDRQCRRWNDRYYILAEGLGALGLKLPKRRQGEAFVASSIQFFVPERDDAAMRDFIRAAAERGVDIKWFGDATPRGYTSRFDSWHYLESTQLPQTMQILATLCDMRIPLIFDEQDCRQIIELIGDALAAS